MPLGTLDRTPPPFFRQGPSALSRLLVCSALALLLMVADARLRISQPLRAAVATVLYPLQWLALQPVQAARGAGAYLRGLREANAQLEAARRTLVQQTQRAAAADLLDLENRQLRELLGLRERLQTPARAATVLYDAADPHTRRVVLDRGSTHGVMAGSPVVDAAGVLGQVTRVHPLVSEATLIIDRDQAIPVLNTRTGARGVAFGEPQGGALELRYMAANADVREGDALLTSGVDGVYPAGLPVATVERVERRADSAFARIVCRPAAQVDSSRHVLILEPTAGNLPPRPEPEPTAPSARRGPRRTPPGGER